MNFAYWAVTIYGGPFQALPLFMKSTISRSRNPAAEATVWANPLSLATTRGLSVDFFSTRY